MPHPCHIIVEDNPAIIFASRNGGPEKILPTLKPFLHKFWQERDLLGESADTPECLVAQITVRFGFEICEDDFSNLKVGLNYDSRATYLYHISRDRQVTVWLAGPAYRQDPALGLGGCSPAPIDF
jgi:hypothetical protein